ncbi:MAG TPA: 30S ribosomal protein S12 methylthiotransferase RimO [Syntrophales bacterium]|nr:30S ribosomal protein S12 methylthiotransferase RimO [Syntrophales bacterium]
MMKKTIHIISLGCPKNLVDSEVMAASLEEEGFVISAHEAEAEILLLNTCAFILPAKEESIEEILRLAQWKMAGKCAYLVVTGCLPQRYGNEMARELPEVDLFLGTGEVGRTAGHIHKLVTSKEPVQQCVVHEPSFLMTAANRRQISTPFYSAYLKIADGCTNRCSYCVIPAIRGRARSRSMEDICREAEELVRRGVRELIITAQDTTAYGRDLPGKPTLSNLLTNLCAINNVRWIRLLYTYPAELTDDVFFTIARETKICPYIDIPIQHIDDDILRLMHRRGGSQLIREVIRRAREIIPDVSLRTSLIVGFPGETPSRFQKLLHFVDEARFDHLGVFTYSPEEDTEAQILPGQVSEKTKNKRKQHIMETQAIVSEEINRSLISSFQEVLVEGKSDIAEYPYVGRSRRQAPDIDGITYIQGKNLSAGDFVTCRITTADEYDLFGVMVDL